MAGHTPIELEFSRKYDRQHAQQYFQKHRAGLMRRLSDWREQQIARAALALAGDPASVLDLPCGAGRFWPMLAERQERRILAADNSADMIAVARATQAPGIVARVEAFQTSAFAIDLAGDAVDCVFSMRLLHHVAEPAHRLAMLREFHRVSRQTVVLSLWVDGNFKAWRRARLEARRPVNNNRFVVPRQVIEGEFAAAGFDIVGYKDFLPGYAMWRVYTLRKRG
ncbi:class I SAM-dependent methyltransferase [Azonexus fungiphilus]|uniref:class I SAM-dependent methyltransferase n=1 Tax=Azonexus fungiphilus TaxID=146940 RepID=UPI00156AA3A0|nr:class I SAM-dependent methyltransferase [Azonexus fungiphilus]NHC06541.1 class I SAM-dependent methyltransferase [Azonexus fungiphilus]